MTPSATINLSGLVSPSLRTYNTFRSKRANASVQFQGSVSKARCCFGTHGWQSGYWRMGLRNRAESQFSSIIQHPYTDLGSFPNTANRGGLEFAINTRGYDMPASDAVADFWGTLVY